MALNQPDVEELLRNYPNQYEHHVKQVKLREQGDLSMLMNLHLINQINDDLNEIHYF